MRVITLVLDLDETLVSIEEHHVTKHDFSFKGPDSEMFYGRKRPGLEEFVNYISRNPRFRVVVWSAGLDFYVDAICREIFPADAQPVAVFSRRFCDIGPDFYVEKPLRKLYDLGRREGKVEGRHDCPGVLCDFDPELTLFIDDNPTTFSQNPENALWVNEFRGESDDSTLVRLKAALMSLETESTIIADLYKPILNHVRHSSAD